MKIAIVGTGYVGLVSGVCFSDFGHEVICIDKTATKIAMLKKGHVPIYEPGLDAVLARNVAAGCCTWFTIIQPTTSRKRCSGSSIATPIS